MNENKPCISREMLMLSLLVHMITLIIHCFLVLLYILVLLLGYEIWGTLAKGGKKDSGLDRSMQLLLHCFLVCSAKIADKFSVGLSQIVCHPDFQGTTWTVVVGAAHAQWKQRSCEILIAPEQLLKRREPMGKADLRSIWMAARYPERQPQYRWPLISQQRQSAADNM